MDIDLFSEIVKGLILDNDEVTLPGLGSFVSGLEPSSFSDKGYTINPPYRRLSFRQRESGNVRLLAEFYAEANGTDYETSERILSDFISGLRTTLQTRKVVVFPGLGRLRATKENAFFFIADEDLDIYPYGVGLELVSLKTHEETPEEVSEGVAALRELVVNPELKVQEAEGQAEAQEQSGNEPAEETSEPLDADTEAMDEAIESSGGISAPLEETRQSGETVVLPVDAPKTEDSGSACSPDSAGDQTRAKEEDAVRSGDEDAVRSGDKDAVRLGEEETGRAGEETGRRAKGRGWKTAAIAVAAVAGAAILALGIFILLSRVAPDFIDSLLYTPEELRIINY